MFRDSGNLRLFRSLARDAGSWEECSLDKEIWKEPENRRNMGKTVSQERGRLKTKTNVSLIPSHCSSSASISRHTQKGA